jgi:hypothetical protein
MNPLIPILGTAVAAPLAGAAAEMAARVWFDKRGKYHVWQPRQKYEVHLDPEGLPWLPPVARWSINSVGERGVEPPSDWSDTARVLVSGGSTTECYFIDQPSTWSEVLSERLNAPGVPQALGAAKVHVGNIGRSVTDAEYLNTMFEKILPNYERLDVAVLFIGNSEVVRWMHLREAAEYPKVKAPIPRLFGSHPEGPFGWSPATLASRRMLSALKWRLTNKPDILERSGKRLPHLRAQRTNAANWIEKISDPSPLLNHYDQTLRQLLRTLRGRAKRVLFVAQPWLDKALDSEEHKRTWNFGFGQPYQEDLDTYYSYEVTREMLHLVSEKGLSVAAEEGVEVYDMVPDVPNDWEHYYDSLHHTPLGNALIAKLVAQRILGG